MARLIFRFLNRTGGTLTLTNVQGAVQWEANRAPPAQIQNNNEQVALFIADIQVPNQGAQQQFSFGYRLPATAQPANGEFRFTVTLQHNQTQIVSAPPGTHLVDSQLSGDFPDNGYSATLT
ncbi:hypothetical protein [Vitiosangium sp. GDMCC 1.1324]|uniref:hypothetical protein n=1 Tax=Vitiosangium sp. (strain GDMCC 1.1324) TaxID=2138576 RepID=UPI000D3D73E7|nr:hypothetical protein [Vitiosangium sp. GDMCC 1.1324]PTL81557.1 hypothetical protein DAT35_21585 [Vitiosangium sp. GDMCC 1.1324]